MPAPLTVTTFNLRYPAPTDGQNHWNHRRDLALQTIRTLDPDILGTQESTHPQTLWLAEHLPDYIRLGVGRQDGKTEGEACPLYLRTSRFTLEASGTFWLSEAPDTPGSQSWDSCLPRIVTWAHTRDTLTGLPLTILNTHLDVLGPEARFQSAAIIRRWLIAHAAGHPTLLLGDFNAKEDSPEYRALIDPSASPQLRDAYRSLHPTRTPDEATFHHFRGITKGSRIDYILHTPNLQPLTAEVDRTAYDHRYPSDHYPLTATFRQA